MTEWIVTSSVLILIIVILRIVLKGKINPSLQYGLWALVLVRLLVPFSLPASSVSVMNAVPNAHVHYSSVNIAPASDAVTDNFVNIEAAADSTAINESTESTVEPKNSMSVYDVLMLIWYIGIVVVGAVFIISNFRFAHKLKRIRKPLELSNTNLPVYITGSIETPCLFGVFRPAIYVTPEVAGNKNVLRHCIAHECTHYRHGDYMWSLLRAICLAVHWYNPLVWLAAVLSRRDAELSCDVGTVKQIGEENRMEYGRTLIELTCSKARASDLLRCATTMTGGKRSIKERIVLIAKKPKMLISTAIAVVLIAALAVGCTFTGSSTKNITPETAAAQELFNARTDYVGDNSAVGKLIGLVGYPENLEFESFEINTDLVPYGVYIYFNTDTESLDKLDTANLQDNSMLLLALIGNLDEVYYMVTDGNSETGVRTSRAMADAYLGCSVSDYGGSVEKVQELLDFSFDSAVTAPDNVVKTAEHEIEARYNSAIDAMPEYELTNWRLDSLYEVYTNEETINANLRVYSMRYSFWSDAPDNVIMAGAAHFRDDGWFCPTYDGCNYLVYDSETGECLFPIMINEDAPGGLLFTQALNDALESIGIDLHIDTTRLEEFYANAVMPIPASSSDISDEGVSYPSGDIGKAFGNAVLANNESVWDDYDYALESHNILGIVDGERIDENGITVATKTFYAVTLNLCVNVTSNGIEEVSGGHMPVAVTFDVIDDGKFFVVSEYWIPEDGSYYEPSIRDCFPDDIEDEAMNMPKYILPQMQDCYRQAVEKSGMDTVPVLDTLLEEIISSPKESSNPSDYIDAHPIEYREMTYYGEYTVSFIENEFNENGQTGLRGEILALLLDDLKG